MKVTAAKNSLPSWDLLSCAPTLELHQEPREENAAYIATWLEVLKNDNRAIFAAAAHAQRAADYLRGRRAGPRDLRGLSQIGDTCARLPICFGRAPARTMLFGL